MATMTIIARFSTTIVYVTYVLDPLKQAGVYSELIEYAQTVAIFSTF